MNVNDNKVYLEAVVGIHLTSIVLLVYQSLLCHHKAAIKLVILCQEEHVTETDPPHLQAGPELS